MHFMSGKGQEVVRVTLLRLGATTSLQLERTVGTNFRVEAGLPAGRATREHGNCLSLRAGDRVGFALLILLEAKVREPELVWGRLRSANRSLNEGNSLLLQGMVADFTAVPTVGDHGFDGGACFQIGQGLCQELAVIHMVGRNLHFRDELDLIFRITGFGEVRNVAFVMSCAFGTVRGFEIIHRL